MLSRLKYTLFVVAIVFLSGCPKGARIVVKEAIELNPNYSKAYFNLALVLETLGKQDEAADNYQNFIDKAQSRIEELERGETLPGH